MMAGSSPLTQGGNSVKYWDKLYKGTGHDDFPDGKYYQ